MPDTDVRYTIVPVTVTFDVTANAGEPFDLTVPITDASGASVPIGSGQASAWVVAASISANVHATTPLWRFTTTPVSVGEPGIQLVPGPAAAVRLWASGTATASWQQTWPRLVAHLDVWLTEPRLVGGADLDNAATRYRLGSGPVRLLPANTA